MSDGSRDHSSRNNSGIKDIGLFVENYKSLLDKLFPVFVVWDSVLYISRFVRRSRVEDTVNDVHTSF